MQTNRKFITYSIITADVKFLLLSNKLILIIVLYCNLLFSKMAKIEIVYFEALAGNRQFAVLIVNR